MNENFQEACLLLEACRLRASAINQTESDSTANLEQSELESTEVLPHAIPAPTEPICMFADLYSCLFGLLICVMSDHSLTISSTCSILS